MVSEIIYAGHDPLIPGCAQPANRAQTGCAQLCPVVPTLLIGHNI